MFFEHREFLAKGANIDLSQAKLNDEFCDGYIAMRFACLRALFPKTGEVCRTVKICRDGAMEAEEYSVDINKDTTVISAGSARGAVYALSDIKDMVLTNGEVKACYFKDAPDCAFRAYHIFLPSRNKLDEFFEMAQFLSDYKYNTFIIEIGGAMQYERHPKINEAWSAFAADMRRYSGRSLEVQLAYAWEKNSIHADNAEGEVLTQSEVKYIFDRLKEMHFDVIPEVPLLSHTDYICLAYPELAERADDPYPDTYCPSHPKTYEVVFDILDEVIALLAPKTVNIGHDEYYSMAQCERCKGKEPVDIFCGDIIKLYNYLEERNISTMMWAEKLLDARRNGDEKIGGAGIDRINEAGYYVTVPALFPCAERLPKDILMMNWYWNFGAELDKAFTANGFPFIYGNLYGAEIDCWRDRVKSGAKGGCISNWGGFDDKLMQRNLQQFSLASAAYMFWSATYDSPAGEKLIDTTAKALYERYRSRIRPEALIEIEHSANISRPHEFFYDGVFAAPNDLLGHYEISYAGGQKACLAVEYGYNISGVNAEKGSREYAQAFVATLPKRVAGKTVYLTAYRNPYPDEQITGISFVPIKAGGEAPEYRIVGIGGRVK